MRHRIQLNVPEQRVSYVKTNHGDGENVASFAAFQDEVSKPDHDIDLPKAAALLASHADDKVNAVDVVMKQLSALKAGFHVHAAEAVPAAAPLPEAARQQALAGALCNFFAAEGFEGCSAADFYRAESSLLHQVLANKRGIPVSLALLYREVGSAAGLHLRVTSLPGNCLLAFGDGDTAGLVDPLTNRVMNESEASEYFTKLAGRPVKLHPQWSRTAPVPNVVFLRRMTMNLLNVYKRDSHKELTSRLTPYAHLLHSRMEQLAKAHGAT